MKQRLPAGESPRPTKVEKLHRVLSDKRWHSTKELARRIGHTFHVAKWKLIHVNGYPIERRRYDGRLYQHQYRLLDEPKP